MPIAWTSVKARLDSLALKIRTASAPVISDARVATVGSTASRSSDDTTARPTSSSTFSSATDWARSRVRSLTFCSSWEYEPCNSVAMKLNCVGELFEFVGRLDVDALAKIAGAQSARTGLQGADRHQHVAGEEASREHGDDQAERDQRCVAQQQIVERQARLAERLFEEHVPFQVRDQFRRGQDRAAVDTGAG